MFILVAAMIAAMIYGALGVTGSKMIAVIKGKHMIRTKILSIGVVAFTLLSGVNAMIKLVTIGAGLLTTGGLVFILEELVVIQALTLISFALSKATRKLKFKIRTYQRKRKLNREAA